MVSLTYAQLEPIGTCRHDCKICLPRARKTNTRMSLKDIDLLIPQLQEAGVRKVTLAGFGNPVEHPDYMEIVRKLAADFEVSVTCRVGDLDKVGPVHRANVSVCGMKDALGLIERVTSAMIYNLPLVSPHIVVTHDLAFGLNSMLHVLGSWADHFERITLAPAIALCGDPRHRREIAKENKHTNSIWVAGVGDYPHSEKMQLAGVHPRLNTCSWVKQGVYINANLDVLPCCNLPCVTPFGNLRAKTLQEVRQGDAYRRFTEKKLPECAKCPDLGG